MPAPRLAGAALIVLAVATSPQPTIALAVVGATLAAFVLLRLVALAIAVVARRWPGASPVEMRMALAAIHRPGALTVSVVLSLGLGLTALVALTLIDFNMRAELQAGEPGVTPSFFFLDVRSADAGAFLDFLKREAPGAKVDEVPMLRGRFVTIDGVPAAKVKASDKVAWALEGDRGVTFAAKPPEGSEVVAGRWWPPDYAGPPLVSMEKEVADGLGIKVGDTVVVNVLGRDIEAKVANLRKVNWRSYAINFVLVYSPNTFKGAPYSELVSTALPKEDGPGEEIALLRAVARDFPNVASVSVRDALDLVEALVAKLALAIRAATGVALLTSVLVLAGALAANRRARLADATILKILGATRAAADRDVPDRIRHPRRGDRGLRHRRRDADRLARRHPDHAGRLPLRLARRLRRGLRRLRLHRRPRPDRRLAGPQPAARRVPARIIGGRRRVPIPFLSGTCRKLRFACKGLQTACNFLPKIAISGSDSGLIKGLRPNCSGRLTPKLGVPHRPRPKAPRSGLEGRLLERPLDKLGAGSSTLRRFAPRLRTRSVGDPRPNYGERLGVSGKSLRPSSEA